jgi:hypothetical protein
MQIRPTRTTRTIPKRSFLRVMCRIIQRRLPPTSPGPCYQGQLIKALSSVSLPAIVFGSCSTIAGSKA